MSFTACSINTFDLEKREKKDNEKNLFKSGIQNFKEHRYKEAIHDFETFESTYPLSSLAKIAQKFSLVSYFFSDDFTMTKAACDRFLLEHPKDPDADYVAYISLESSFMLAMNYPLNIIPTQRYLRQTDNLKELYLQSLDFIKEFKDSSYCPNVARKLPYIREIITEHELDTIEYLYRKKQYFGFIKKVDNLKKHFPSTIQAKKADTLYQKLLAQLKTEKILLSNEKIKE